MSTVYQEYLTLHYEGTPEVGENIKRAAWLPQSKIKLSALLEHNFKKRQQIHDENTHCSFHKYSLFQVEYFERRRCEPYLKESDSGREEKLLREAQRQYTFAFQLLKTDVNKVHVKF